MFGKKKPKTKENSLPIIALTGVAEEAQRIPLRDTLKKPNYSTPAIDLSDDGQKTSELEQKAISLADETQSQPKNSEPAVVAGVKEPFNPYAGCYYAAVFGRRNPDRRDLIIITRPIEEEGDLVSSASFRAVGISSNLYNRVNADLPLDPQKDPALISALGARSLEGVKGRLVCYVPGMLNRAVPGWHDKARPLTDEEMNKYFPKSTSKEK